MSERNNIAPGTWMTGAPHKASTIDKSRYQRGAFMLGANCPGSFATSTKSPPASSSRLDAIHANLADISKRLAALRAS